VHVQQADDQQGRERQRGAQPHPRQQEHQVQGDEHEGAEGGQAGPGRDRVEFVVEQAGDGIGRHQHRRHHLADGRDHGVEVLAGGQADEHRLVAEGLGADVAVEYVHHRIDREGRIALLAPIEMGIDAQLRIAGECAHSAARHNRD